ncbi:MAG: dependent protein [Thermodesulfobacteriota bacterium]|nr:dependent protein [Thermodesulfobacteriota bacterium]
MTENAIRRNVEDIWRRIGAAAARAGRRADDVRLMAVTKTVDDQRIIAAIAAGVDIVGENYVQEAKRKIELMGRPREWHLIGHLQTNKAKYAVKLFDMIHSVDRTDVALELNRRAAKEERLIKILIEVNISGEATKRGIDATGAPGLIKEVSRLEHLSIQGLMTMAPWFDDPEAARPCFASLRSLRDRIADAGIPGVTMRELSMGMSGDFEIAVEEGATIVRVGRSLFGERPASSISRQP